MTRTLRLAHRGDWRSAPENSLAAMLAALAIPNCDGLEFDVRADADGVPILLHDPTLVRVQGVPWAADELGASALAGYGIPTLEEVLDAVPEDAFLDVELKDDPGPDVIPVLEHARGPGLANAVVSSFELATLAAIRRARPAWSCWLNADHVSHSTIRAAARLGCSGIAIRWTAIDEETVGHARASGLDVVAWTVRDVATFDRLAALGVVAVCAEAAALDG